MSGAKQQHCPICQAEVSLNARYPRYLCRECAAKAVDEDGRALSFANVDFSGGFAARYADTGEKRDSHVCLVNGVNCRADEARFGGIVIQTSLPPAERDHKRERRTLNIERRRL